MEKIPASAILQIPSSEVKILAWPGSVEVEGSTNVIVKIPVSTERDKPLFTPFSVDHPSDNLIVSMRQVGGTLLEIRVRMENDEKRNLFGCNLFELGVEGRIKDGKPELRVVTSMQDGKSVPEIILNTFALMKTEDGLPATPQKVPEIVNLER